MLYGKWLLLCSESSSSSYFLHRKILDSLDCVCLQLDCNATCACDQNALRHSSSSWYVRPELIFRTRKKPLIHNFTVSGNGILGKITKMLVAKVQQSLSVNPFTPESDQCQNSPAASQEIWHHTVWRTWLFIAYSDEKWLYYKFLLHHSYNCFLKGWENTLFELRSERVNMLVLLLYCQGKVFLYFFVFSSHHLQWMYQPKAGEFSGKGKGVLSTGKTAQLAGVSGYSTLGTFLGETIPLYNAYITCCLYGTISEIVVMIAYPCHCHGHRCNDDNNLHYDDQWCYDHDYHHYQYHPFPCCLGMNCHLTAMIGLSIAVERVSDILSITTTSAMKNRIKRAISCFWMFGQPWTPSVPFWTEWESPSFGGPCTSAAPVITETPETNFPVVTLLMLIGKSCFGKRPYVAFLAIILVSGQFTSQTALTCKDQSILPWCCFDFRKWQYLSIPKWPANTTTKITLYSQYNGQLYLQKMFAYWWRYFYWLLIHTNFAFKATLVEKPRLYTLYEIWPVFLVCTLWWQ